MPRASSRSSAEACLELVGEAVEERPGGLRVARVLRPRHAHIERHRDEALLGAVVEVALDPAPRGVGGLDDAGARGVQLLGARRLDLAPPQRLLGLAALGDVEDGAVHPLPPARPLHELAAIEHPADLAVGADDPVLEHERPVGVVGVLDRVEDALAVVGVDDAHQRPLGAGDEVRRRVAGDALDLVADQREREVRVPGRAVDRARDVDHQRAQERVVGALLGRVHAGARAGEQLGAGERALDVVVGARVQRGDGRAAVVAVGDREQPRLPEPRVVAQQPAVRGGVVAADQDQLGRRLGKILQGRLGVGHRAAVVAGRAQPRRRLRPDVVDDEQGGFVPPQISGGVGQGVDYLHTQSPDGGEGLRRRHRLPLHE